MADELKVNENVPTAEGTSDDNSVAKKTVSLKITAEDSQTRPPDKFQPGISTSEREIDNPVSVSRIIDDKPSHEKTQPTKIPPRRKPRSVCRSHSRDPMKCQKSIREIIGKHETRNEELEQLEGDMRERLEMLECSMPAVMVWNVLRMSQGASPSEIRDLMEKQLQRMQAVGNASVASTPSQHYDHRVREIEAERKEALRRAEEARVLLMNKEAMVMDRQKQLEEAKKCNQEKKERMEKLNSEVAELREALRKKALEGDGSCQVGECGEIRCKEKLLDDIGSLSSIRSTDLECFARLQELAESEVCMKRQISELERREDAYMRTLQQAEEMWSKMGGETPGNLAELQEQLNIKTTANKHLADRICELEDELEKTKKKLRNCSDDLKQFKDKTFVDAEVGFKDDVATVTDRGTSASVPTVPKRTGTSVPTFDVDTMVRPETVDKESTIVPESSEKAVIVGPKTFDTESEAIAETVEREIDAPRELVVDTAVGDPRIQDPEDFVSLEKPRYRSTLQIDIPYEKSIPYELKDSTFDEGYPLGVSRDMVESSTATESAPERVVTTDARVQATAQTMERPVGGSRPQDIAEISREIESPSKREIKPVKDSSAVAVEAKSSPTLDKIPTTDARVQATVETVEQPVGPSNHQDRIEISRDIESLPQKDKMPITDAKVQATVVTAEQSVGDSELRDRVEMRHEVESLEKRPILPTTTDTTPGTRKSIERVHVDDVRLTPEIGQETQEPKSGKDDSKRKDDISSITITKDDRSEKRSEQNSDPKDSEVTTPGKQSVAKITAPGKPSVAKITAPGKPSVAKITNEEKKVTLNAEDDQLPSQQKVTQTEARTEKEPRLSVPQASKETTFEAERRVIDPAGTAGEEQRPAVSSRKEEKVRQVEDDKTLSSEPEATNDKSVIKEEKPAVKFPEFVDQRVPPQREAPDRETVPKDDRGDTDVRKEADKTPDTKTDLAKAPVDRSKSKEKEIDEPKVHKEKISAREPLREEPKPTESSDHRIVSPAESKVDEIEVHGMEYREDNMDPPQEKTPLALEHIESEDEDDIPEAWKDWNWDEGCPPDFKCGVVDASIVSGSKQPREVESNVQKKPERKRSITKSPDIGKVTETTSEREKVVLTREELRNWYNTVNSVHHILSRCISCKEGSDATAQLMGKMNNHLWMMALADETDPMTEYELEEQSLPRFEDLEKRLANTIKQEPGIKKEPAESKRKLKREISGETDEDEQFFDPISEEFKVEVQPSKTLMDPVDKKIEGMAGPSIKETKPQIRIKAETHKSQPIPFNTEPKVLSSLGVISAATPTTGLILQTRREETLPIRNRIQDEIEKSLAEIVQAQLPPGLEVTKPPEKIISMGKLTHRIEGKGKTPESMEPCCPSSCICPKIPMKREQNTDRSQTLPEMPRTLDRIKLRAITESTRRSPDVVMWRRPLIWSRRRKDKSTVTSVCADTQTERPTVRERVTQRIVERKDDCTCSGVEPKRGEFAGSHASSRHADKRLAAPVGYPLGKLSELPRDAPGEKEIASLRYEAKPLTSKESEIRCDECGKLITIDDPIVKCKTSVRENPKAQTTLIQTLKKMATSALTALKKDEVTCGDCKMIGKQQESATLKKPEEANLKGNTCDKEYCCACPSGSGEKVSTPTKTLKKKRKPEKKDQSVTAKIPKTRLKKNVKEKKAIDSKDAIPGDKVKASKEISPAKAGSRTLPSTSKKGIKRSESSLEDSVAQKSSQDMSKSKIKSKEQVSKGINMKVSSLCGCEGKGDTLVPYTDYTGIFGPKNESIENSSIETDSKDESLCNCGSMKK